MPDPNAKPPEPPPADEPRQEPAERSAEEQMADFEQSLKDTDWGHQPC